MKMPVRYSLPLACLISIALLQAGSVVAEISHPSFAMWQAASMSDPVVGMYDCVRYGTTFKFQPDGTIVGGDGLGDGSWQVADASHHIYTVKIRPSMADSPEKSETWTLTLDNSGLTQNAGQMTIFSRMK